jgi:hypothetical protein
VAFTPKQHKEYRNKLREQGICIHCHKRAVREGMATCKTCAIAIYKITKRLRKVKDRCNNCFNKLGEFDIFSGRRVCPNCLERSRIMDEIRRNRI